VVPYTTNVVTLGVGQRTDVIVEAKNQLTGAFWMRANLDSCSFVDGVSPLAVAAVYYPLTSTSTSPTTTSDVTVAQLSYCANDPLNQTVSWCPSTPDPNPPTTSDVLVRIGSNGTNFVWFMNGESFHGDYNDPTLLAVNAGNMTFEPEWNVFNFGTNSSVRMVITNTFGFGGHPMHLHGHNFHVLAEGQGTWDGVVTNPNNTQQRDVQYLQAATQDGTPSYVVLQWQQDNPAVWPLHCHIAWHVSAGLYINVLERPDDVMKLQVPASASQNCRAWGAYTNTTIPDQIDSGL
jgi:FtsP/CotA-like multicopper oxidase with cupredoxin domain